MSNNWLTELSSKIAAAKTHPTVFAGRSANSTNALFLLVDRRCCRRSSSTTTNNIRPSAAPAYLPRLTQFGRSRRRCEDRETIRFASVHSSNNRSQCRCRKIWSDSTDTRPVTCEARNLYVYSCGLRFQRKEAKILGILWLRSSMDCQNSYTNMTLTSPWADSAMSMFPVTKWPIMTYVIHLTTDPWPITQYTKP